MGRFRDAITGLFTTKAHAEANPDTTIRETRTKPSEPGCVMTTQFELPCGCIVSYAVRDIALRNVDEAANFVDHAAGLTKHWGRLRYQQHRCPNELQ